MLKTFACALTMAASFPTAAIAADNAKSETVRFDDLNLASPAGIAKLDRRLASAARRVCGYNETRGYSYILPTEVAECMDDALASARQQIAVRTGAAIRKG